MAAKSDGGRSPQSAAAPKTEGSPRETVLGACGLRPEAQHPRLNGKEGTPISNQKPLSLVEAQAASTPHSDCTLRPRMKSAAFWARAAAVTKALWSF